MDKFKFAVPFLSAALLSGCLAESADSIADNLSDVQDDSVSIEVIFQNELDDAVTAYEMAVEDIEKLNSPVNINVNVHYDESDYTKGLDIAQQICSDDSVVGVVSKMSTDICLSLKNLYQENSIPMLLPVTNSDEIKVTDNCIYQMLPNMTTTSRMFTTLAYMNEKMKNSVIIYSDDGYGNEFSKILEQSLTEDKVVKVVDKICMPDIYTDIPDCMKKWRALDTDSVFLIGGILMYQYYVPVIRELNPDINIYYMADYEGEYLSDRITYEYYDNIYQFSFVQDNYSEQISDFNKRFEEKFGKMPNSDTVQVYDNIMIIAKAVAENGVRTPDELKNFIESSDDIGSIFGKVSFDTEERDVDNKICFIQNYDESGNLKYSLGLTNNEIDDIWSGYYNTDIINEFARLEDYRDNEG